MAEEKVSGTEHKRDKVVHAIFGCGRIGYAVAKELKKHGTDMIIVDIDDKKVELLKEEDFIAFTADISDPSTVELIKGEGKPEVVFVMSSNSEVNRKAVKNIREKLPDTSLVARAIEPGDKEALKDLGADIILAIPDLTARTALEYLERLRYRKKVNGLMGILNELKKKPDARLGVVVHDSPDPDSIASGLALRQIAHHAGVSADIVYRGEIGHHVNRAFVNILGIEMRRIEGEEDLLSYDKLALVDSSQPGANNPVTDKCEVAIIIDHHQVTNNKGKVDAEFVDIQTNCGATSTIMTNYLRELNVPVDRILATALLHGIITDTNGFKREAHPADFYAAAYLYLRADKDLLDQIETPPMSTEMLNVVGGAIQHKKIKGSYLITSVGTVANRDAIPQAADYLLNLEGISTVVVIGLCEDTICVSGRSKDVRVNIGEAFARAFGDIGTAGGHATMAAAQLPLGIFKGVKDRETIMRLAEDAVSRRFLAVMKEEKTE